MSQEDVELARRLLEPFSRVRTYLDHGEALEAVGLGE
jgi:hypothetical protein